MWCNAFVSIVILMSWEDFFNCQGANTRVQIKFYSNDLIMSDQKCCQIISKNVLRLKSEESLVQIQSTINHKAQIHMSCQKQRSFPIISQYHHLDSNQTIRFANLSSWANLFLSSSTHCDNPPNPLPYPWLSPGGDDGGSGDSFKEDMER